MRDRDTSQPSDAGGVTPAIFTEIWRNPGRIIAAHKDLLRARGESLVEKLGECPLAIRIAIPLSLLDSQVRISDAGEIEGNLRIVAERDVTFRMYVYGDRTTGEEHVALIKGIGDGTNIPIRVHSSCITAETFHATNCDCHEQLTKALDITDREGVGGVIWLHQEGRGNGLTGKAEQLGIMFEHGVDTVEAFERAGYPPDQRDYTIAADILKDLGITSIRLITNNPDKIRQLTEAGISVVGRIPCITAPLSEVARRDLLAKKDRLGHQISDDV
jgi:GTP cyclohydrolase II